MIKEKVYNSGDSFTMLWLSQKRPGSPKERDDKTDAKPPLPIKSASHFRKGTYHESLDFVHSLCETSYGLVDIFPVEDRKTALREVVLVFSLKIFECHVSLSMSLLLIFYHNIILWSFACSHLQRSTCI